LLDTPAHAAVGTAVELARVRGFAPFAALVNAVLRKLAAQGPSMLAELDCPRLDTPAWLWKKLGANARAIATAHQAQPPVDLTKHRPCPQLGGIELPNGSIRVPAGTRIMELPGFAEGAFWVQDAAATFPVALLAPRPGERIADLCAAPGGKTAQLAAAGARVTAVERDATRAERLRANLARLRLRAEIQVADAAEWEASEPFDAVLLDAPCSATGTIRRHPDVLRLKRPRDVSAMTQIQDRLLARSARLVRSGGRLVYAVCSLQPEEGEPRVAALLRHGGWRLAPFAPDELRSCQQAITRDGFLRTHPGLWPELGGMDGFFAARLIRL